MRSILFSLSLLLLFITLTNIPKKEVAFTNFHTYYELMAYDNEIKEIFNKNTFSITKNDSTLIINFHPNLTNLYQSLQRIKKFSDYSIPLNFNQNYLELTGTNENNKIIITQINNINSIFVKFDNYSSINIFVNGSYQNISSDFNESLQNQGDALFKLSFIGYSSCSNCFINFSKFHNASFNYSISNYPFVLNISMYDKGINITYTGNPQIHINFSTNISEELLITKSTENIVLEANQTYNCNIISLPRLPVYAHTNQISIGKLDNYSVLVVNSSVGEFLYIDKNNNCRFDDISDIKIAKQGDFISMNDKIYKIEKISYGKGCKIRWKVYANDTEDAWSESQTFEFITSQ
ncbi:MAG: hypothetical protein QW076_01365 [Candidatus Anstonellales archaeon]